MAFSYKVESMKTLQSLGAKKTYNTSNKQALNPENLK